MNKHAIEDKLRDILIKDLFVECAREEIRSDSSLRTDLGIDSLGFVELKEQVETEFGVAISDAEFTPDNFSSVGTLSALISSRVGSG